MPNDHLRDGSPASDKCSGLDIWLKYAAGLLPAQANALLHHAATCDACAKQLKVAIDLMSADQLDEHALPLSSATPAWHREMARKLTAMSSVRNQPESTRVVQMPRRSWNNWRSYTALAAGIVIVAALVGWTIKQYQLHSNAQLLAAAYNKQRRMELRIPGGEPVEMASETRGSTHFASTNLAEPSELLELERSIKIHLDKTPDDLYWRQMRGEVELQENDWKHALDDFGFDSESKATLANLKADLAAAWFERASDPDTDDKERSSDYGQAASIYTEAINRNEGDLSVLYYNRALCWEHQNVRQKAVEDLKSALEQEPSAAWRNVINAEIAKLSNHSANMSGDNYESRLSQATTQWLPDVSTSADIRAKLVKTADLGMRHHDRWLHDWISSTHAGRDLEADRQLSLAMNAGSGGKPSLSLSAATAAEALYRTSGNRPGMDGAVLAEVYALQRLGRAKDCLKRAQGFDLQIAGRDYTWMQTQVLVDEGNCLLLVQDFDRAQEKFDRAFALSEAFAFPVLRLRAMGAKAALFNLRGRRSLAWQLDADGLKSCEESGCPPAREYQFLIDMATAAQGLELPQVAAAVMEAAAKVSAQTGDVTTYAYSLETLGLVEGRAGHPAEAARAFQQATDLSQSNHDVLGDPLYQADWQIDRAEVQALNGNGASALDLLQHSAFVLNSDYRYDHIRYLTVLATAQMTAGRADDALNSEKAAVAQAEQILASLNSVAEREQWVREHTETYTGLVNILLRLGENDQALQAWERFRSAAYRQYPGTPAASRVAPQPSSSSRVLIIADLGDKYVGWVTTAESLHALHTAVLADHRQLKSTARLFYRLCADPNSSLDDVQSVGSFLYASLIAPFHEDLAQSSHLWVDMDPSLSMLPFAALRSPQKSWLGDTETLTMLPAWWAINQQRAMVEHALLPVNKMVIVDGFGDNSQRFSRSESMEIAALFPGSASVKRGGMSMPDLIAMLRTADIFQFSGHASTDVEPHLILASNSTAPPLLLGPESLKSVRLPVTRMVVLAACNTTASNPDRVEDLVDLRQSLLLSGAHLVIASKWDVEDRSTHVLMLEFYRQLAGGKPPSAAIQGAHQLVRRTVAWQHPYFWASFENFTS